MSTSIEMGRNAIDHKVNSESIEIENASTIVADVVTTKTEGINAGATAAIDADTSVAPSQHADETCRIPSSSSISVDLKTVTRTSSSLPSLISPKKSFANLDKPRAQSDIGADDCKPRLAYLFAYLVTTLCAACFVFLSGWPLLTKSVAPEFQAAPSDVHFKWVVATSETCEALGNDNTLVLSRECNKTNNMGAPHGTILQGAGVFVVHRREQSVIAGLSILLDVSVLAYHFTHEPHPKFRLVLLRKLCIYTHILGGTLEILFGILAFTTGMSSMASLAAGVALLLQVPTSMFQAYSVFGSKRLLVPVAQLANVMHTFAAVRLLLQPLSTEALLSMILVVHMYVWARFFYACFNRLRILRDASYTLSIAMSGILVIPSALEFVKTVHVFACVGIYNAMLLLLAHFCCGGDPYAGENNHLGVASKLRASEDVHVPPRMKDLGLDSSSDDLLARVVFEEIDSDGSGAIGVDELRCLLQSWGLPPSEACQVMAHADRDGNGVIEFQEFRDRMQPVWIFGAKVMRSNQIHDGIFEARVA